MFRGHALSVGLVHSLPLGTNKVTELNMFSLTGVGFGTKKVTDREYFYRSLGGKGFLQDGVDSRLSLSFSADRRMW